MSRALRIQYPGAHYHVTCRGNARQAIYSDETDRNVFKEKLTQSLEIYGVDLLGYVLMNNHFHLLLQTPQGNLSEFMRHFNVSYTSAYNRRHRRVGHLYQGRYKSFLIDQDNYLLAVSRYIHLNPIKVKKYKSCTSEAQWSALLEYPYSSFRGYIDLRVRDPFVNYQLVLEQVGGDSPRGRRVYKEFLFQAVTGEVDNPMLLGKGNGIVGDSEFVEWIKETMLSGRADKREQPALNRMRITIDARTLIDRFCTVTGHSEEELCCRGKRPTGRAHLMELLYRYCNLTQPEIGNLVGGVDYSAVSQARKRLRAKLAVDKKMQSKYLAIEQKIIEMSR